MYKHVYSTDTFAFNASSYAINYRIGLVTSDDVTIARQFVSKGFCLELNKRHTISQYADIIVLKNAHM